MIRKTPLFGAHEALKANLVDFHGWMLPIHYGSQLKEHEAVRRDAGMFDVSHMTVVDILGAGGRQFLRRLLTNDVDALKHRGSGLYSCMCNEHGGIIDDLIVYQRASDNFRLVLNAATKARDLEWLFDKIGSFSAGLQERNELAMLAVQGPNAIQKTLSVLTPAQADAIATLSPFECVDVDDWFFARTGYTGEDGLEVILPAASVTPLWDALLAVGVVPCGLGARDTLRLEAGLLLYGQDMDETTTPLESGLSWTVKLNPDDREFIGRGALVSQKERGLTRKLVGLTLKEKGVMRAHQRVIVPGFEEGVITSGTYSPTRGVSIALARVPVGTFDEVRVEIRGKLIPAAVGKPRFVKHGQVIE